MRFRVLHTGRAQAPDNGLAGHLFPRQPTGAAWSGDGGNHRQQELDRLLRRKREHPAIAKLCAEIDTPWAERAMAEALALTRVDTRVPLNSATEVPSAYR